MDLGLKNKVIIISSAIKGIGETIARLLIAENAVPVFIAEAGTDNDRILEDINTGSEKCWMFTADIASPDDCSEVINKIINSFGRIDGIVNIPVVNETIELKACDYEDFRKSMQQNIVPYFLMTHYALPELKASKGVIVNITYLVSSKSKQNSHTALTREWAVELLPYKIRVNAVAIHGNDYFENNLANSIVFLLSERASHITGEIIYAGSMIYHSKKMEV